MIQRICSPDRSDGSVVAVCGWLAVVDPTPATRAPLARRRRSRVKRRSCSREQETLRSCTTMAQNERVAKLLDGLDGLIFTTGDNAYEKGTLEEFEKCYGPTWGRHRARTRPSPGNHDYYTPGATGYFQYYGELAGPPGVGYYSFDHGAWKILSLNSNVPAGPGSAQYNWVAEELRNSPRKCTLAYWHHPVFSSGYEGNMPNMRPIWQLLYDNNAEVVLVGHSHNYERFAPQDLNGQPQAGTRNS